MPKNKVRTIHVNKEIFQDILKQKNSSIRKLGSANEISFTEKTIRRALNNGEMRPELVKQIAKYLDIDSTLLTGEMVKKAFTAKNSVFRDMYLSPLHHLDDFPYFREEQRDFQTVKQDGAFETGGMQETMKRLLALFEVSYDQFEKLTFDQQYTFQYDLFNAMIPIIEKHFKEDAYGNSESYYFEGILNDLENYKEHHDEIEYANTELRQRYLENPPKGLTREQIKKMSPEALLDYDIDLQMEKDYDSEQKDPFAKKYAGFTIIEEDDTDDDIRKKKEQNKNNRQMP